MNRLFILLLIGALTFIVLMFANNPDFFNEIWLYVIGLSGGILKVLSLLRTKISSFSTDLTNWTHSQEEVKTNNQK
ncbi:MAG TPA: hypothetical protein PLX35_07980 [Cyclobacteriaceae bacterium]|nr:hypothetical protein [Cyclobacteriaceae bacterium]